MLVAREAARDGGVFEGEGEGELGILSTPPR